MMFECAVLFVEPHADTNHRELSMVHKAFYLCLIPIILMESHEVGLVHITHLFHVGTLRSKKGEKCFPVSPS